MKNRFCVSLFLYLITAGFLIAQDEEIRIRYQYCDGNNNIYWIHSDTILFIPVKPEYSSSGYYDGGQPVECVVSKQELKTLTQLLDQVLTNPSLQIENRIKGSALIIRYDARKRQAILHPATKEKEVIETLLNRYTGRE